MTIEFTRFFCSNVCIYLFLLLGLSRYFYSLTKIWSSTVGWMAQYQEWGKPCCFYNNKVVLFHIDNLAFDLVQYLTKTWVGSVANGFSRKTNHFWDKYEQDQDTILLLKVNPGKQQATKQIKDLWIRSLVHLLKFHSWRGAWCVCVSECLCFLFTGGR